MSSARKFILHHKKRLLAIGLWLIIFGVTRSVMAVNQLTLSELIDQLIIILKSTWFGVFLFIICYVLRPLLLIPGTIMNLMAGIVYGLFPGIFISVGASYISGTVTYTLTRWLIHEKPDADGRIGEIIKFMQNNPFEAVASIQLMYVSLDITSSLAGILHLPFRYFMIGIMIGGTIPNAIGVVMGSSIEGSIESGTLHIRLEMIVLSLAIMLFTLSISTYLRRRNKLT